MMMNLGSLVRLEYRSMFDSICKQTTAQFFERFSDMYTSGILRDDAWTLLNDKLKHEVGAELATVEMLEGQDIYDGAVLTLADSRTVSLVFVTNWITRPETQKQLLKRGVDEIILVLPHLTPNYVRNQRFLIDKILTDGQLRKCTDVHILPVADFKGGYEYVIKYRQGIYLYDITHEYSLSKKMVDNIIFDMINSRSRSSSKIAKVLSDTEVRFSLIDPLYPSRCTVTKTIWGPALVIRFFDFKSPFRISSLGFDEIAQRDLRSLSELTSGLSLVSGVIGSGKGTTINAVALAIQESAKYSIISIDSPTEYLGKFPQIEYQSENHLYQACNAVKKMDINFALLNEIATQETAKAVYNLVVSGCHVMTTIHSNRVYRVPYKLREMLGDLYLNLIPFLNFLSYQDKFSITCPACQQKVSAEFYQGDADKLKLLQFFNLDIIQQPQGCDECKKKKILDRGIQVVSEHLMFNSFMRDELLRVDIHKQSWLLKQYISKSVNLEDILKEKLLKGQVLIDEVITKLDSWR